MVVPKCLLFIDRLAVQRFNRFLREFSQRLSIVDPVDMPYRDERFSLSASHPLAIISRPVHLNRPVERLLRILVSGFDIAKVPFVDRVSRSVEPIGEWTSAELKAELKELGLSTSGNKQELYDKLLEYEEDWGDEEDSGLSDALGGVANLVVRNRGVLGAVVGVLLLLSAIIVAGPVVIDMIMPAEEEPPEVGIWEFSFEQKNWTEIQTFFVNDDSTETVPLVIPMPNNVSEVYIGAYWGEEDEQPGGIVGCDLVTVEVFDTSVSKPQLYTLSSTDASSQDCDADKTEPWDKIWYHYSLDIPNASGFEGTEEEARESWELYNGTGTGEWRIDVSVDTYAVWGTVCDCEDGEEVRLTISYVEYEVKMSLITEDESVS